VVEEDRNAVHGKDAAAGVAAFALATFGAESISLDRVLFGKGKSLRGVKSAG
jgi:hypothetical protein